MKVCRNSVTAPAFAAILALAMLSSGCDYIKMVIAKDKLNQGAILYNQGRTKQAQVFFKESIDYDSNNPIARLYLGATLVKDYKAQDDESRKKETANQALDVYKEALKLAEASNAPNKCVAVDNAASYLATIYDDLDNFDEWRNWMQQRAEHECTKDKKDVQAQSYYSIAVKYWQCSYDQTTRYADKTNLDSFHYRNMEYTAEALTDKQKAVNCAAKAQEYIEKALAVDPEYVDAMFYKGLVYREHQKLTKEEAKRREYNQMAEKIAKEASALQEKRQAEAVQQQEQQQAAPKG